MFLGLFLTLILSNRDIHLPLTLLYANVLLINIINLFDDNSEVPWYELVL